MITRVEMKNTIVLAIGWMMLDEVDNLLVDAKPPDGKIFHFTVNQTAKKDPRVIKIGNADGCDNLDVTARVTAMPSLLSKGYLLPDEVVEINPQYQVLRRWATPAESPILAIDGNQILISSADAPSQYYWIETSGKFRLQQENKNLIYPKVDYRDTFKSIKGFRDHTSRLVVYQDLRTKQVRRLFIPTPCT